MKNGEDACDELRFAIKMSNREVKVVVSGGSHIRQLMSAVRLGGLGCHGVVPFLDPPADRLIKSTKKKEKVFFLLFLLLYQSRLGDLGKHIATAITESLSPIEPADPMASRSIRLSIPRQATLPPEEGPDLG